MARKIAFVIIALNLIGASLLACRQQRVSAAHDLVELHQRIETHDQHLLRLRVQVLRDTSPDRVHAMIDASPQQRDYLPLAQRTDALTNPARLAQAHTGAEPR